MHSPSSRSRGSLRLAAAAAFSSALVCATPALAAPTEGERAEARALFDEAKRLTAAADYASACPKFAESQRIDPGVGTQFNLADCQEHVGKIASAWENYLEVANQSKTAGQAAREQVARSRAQALAPKLSRLVVQVTPGAQEQGVTVKRDGFEVRKPLWGTPVVADPGEHEIVASAPGKLDQRQSIHIRVPGSVSTVVVAPLVDAPPGLVATAEPGRLDGAPQSGWSKRRIAGLVVGGAGVATLAVGGVVAGLAKGKANDSNASCNPADLNQCDPQGVSTRNDARSLGDVATVLFVGGGVLVAGGAVLWFTAPSSKPAPAVGLRVGPASLAIAGSF
ncbi:MAG TPA: hypothetical protein VGM56_20390 [Byssovorax sp.]